MLMRKCKQLIICRRLWNEPDLLASALPRALCRFHTNQILKPHFTFSEQVVSMSERLKAADLALAKDNDVGERNIAQLYESASKFPIRSVERFRHCRRSACSSRACVWVASGICAGRLQPVPADAASRFRNVNCMFQAFAARTRPPFAFAGLRSALSAKRERFAKATVRSKSGNCRLLAETRSTVGFLRSSLRVPGKGCPVRTELTAR